MSKIASMFGENPLSLDPMKGSPAPSQRPFVMSITDNAVYLTCPEAVAIPLAVMDLTMRDGDLAFELRQASIRDRGVQGTKLSNTGIPSRRYQFSIPDGVVGSRRFSTSVCTIDKVEPGVFISGVVRNQDMTAPQRRAPRGEKKTLTVDSLNVVEAANCNPEFPDVIAIKASISHLNKIIDDGFITITLNPEDGHVKAVFTIE